MKLIRIPLTDISGKDFITGEFVKQREIIQTTRKKINTWRKSKTLQAKEIGRTDGKILVDGFGRVVL